MAAPTVAVEKAVTPLVTADELLRLPSGEFRYELIAGELKQMAPSGAEHAAFGMNLATYLGYFVLTHKLGTVFLAEAGFKIAQNPDTVLAPDMAFIRRERIEVTGLPRGFYPGAPDLAIEVVSPGDTVYEVEEKIAAWLKAGTLVVWVVNPKQRSVAVHRTAQPVTVLCENDELDGGDVVPGFRLPVAAIFE
jgi:Uma2 family endonuclease